MFFHYILMYKQSSAHLGVQPGCVTVGQMFILLGDDYFLYSELEGFLGQILLQCACHESFRSQDSVPRENLGFTKCLSKGENELDLYLMDISIVLALKQNSQNNFYYPLASMAFENLSAQPYPVFLPGTLIHQYQPR